MVIRPYLRQMWETCQGFTERTGRNGRNGSTKRTERTNMNGSTERTERTGRIENLRAGVCNEWIINEGWACFLYIVYILCAFNKYLFKKHNKGL